MTRMLSARSLCFLLWVLALASFRVHAQDFEFRAPATVDDAGTPALMRDLAGRVLPVYEDKDPERYLENLSVLQLVAGDYRSANDSRQSLRDRLRGANPGRPIDRAVEFDLYAHAKAAEAAGGTTFAKAFSQAFHDTVSPLSDRDAYAVTQWLDTPLPSLRIAVQASFDRLRAKPSINEMEAIELIRTYLAYDAHRGFGPLIGTLAGDDDRRRYLAEDDVLIKTHGGVEIHARLVRPKSISKPLPALLEFTISLSGDDARACAAHGYVGVVAYTRGKNKGRARVVPFQHDAEDARAVIGWIVKQPWSDGRVGMYGSGYSGFAAWAATKRLPPALKAIATADAMAPGIDFPMQGRVFHSDAYRWATDNTEPGVTRADGDDAQWRALDQAWYQSGRRFRDLDRMGKKPGPNRIFRRWLNHPSYDRYWQKMIPFGKQFARIDIPVLESTGYYTGGEAGALYYFMQHLHYKPDADHTLLIGPYDDGAMQSGPSLSVRGYPIDAAALIDLRELRFQWFDHVFKGAAKPALLSDRVNYEVMGVNQWRHAASIEAMANGAQRFYLDAAASGDRHRLAQTRPAAAKNLSLTIDLANRGDIKLPVPPSLVSRNAAVDHALSFVSEPIQQPTELSGLPSGRLDFTVNKMDMDLNLTLYELLPGGDYVQLSDPYEFRASYGADRINRRLLKAGERQQLSFRSERMIGRKLQAGSRLVLVLGINKRPDREINYGAGNDVSEESVKDAGSPMDIQWYGSSYIDIPVRK